MESIFIQDPELLRIYAAYINGTAQDYEGLDREFLETIVRMQFRNYERAYYIEQYDLFGESEWGRFERVICAMVENARLSGTAETLPNFLTEEFVLYVESSCGN